MSLRTLTDAGGKSYTVVDVEGYLIPIGLLPTAPEVAKANFEHIPNFKCRDDDVMLLTYPKTGTNWLFEVLKMLLNKTTERIKSNKIMTMLEFNSKEALEQVPSPRVINTHVQFRYLPKELKEKQIKTVLVVRNPKDALVSYYNHMKGIRTYAYDGEWKDWFQLCMQGEIEFGMYTDYLKQIEKAMDDGIGFPFHVIYYEDMHINGLQEVTKLAKFLGVDVDEELCKKILDNCSFDSMLKENKYPEAVREKAFTPGFVFFRKGQIGDWQNWFTVAQNEQFDRYWNKEMEGSKFKFIYTQNTTQ